MSEIVQQPVIVERGRYAVMEMNGGWYFYRASDPCETCLNCGCGEQAEPIQIPADVAQLVMKWQAGTLTRTDLAKAMTGLLASVMGRG